MAFAQASKKEVAFKAKPAFEKDVVGEVGLKAHQRSAWTSSFPNFTATDINGASHTIQSYLNDGKTVVIDLFCAWCSYCWSYVHTPGYLEALNNDPDFVVLMVECETTNTGAQITGTIASNDYDGYTHGDWTSGGTNPVPIIDASSSLYSTLYNYINGGFPTLVMVSPSGFWRNDLYPDQILDETGENLCTTTEFVAHMHTMAAGAPVAGEAPTDLTITNSTATVGNAVSFEAGCTSVDDVTFAWTFEGATPATATGATATTTWSVAGTYEVTLVATNANGSATATKNVTVADCSNGISSYPYTETFDEQGCWTVISNHPENFVTFGLDEWGYLDDNALIFSSYDGDDTDPDFTQWAISPELKNHEGHMIDITFQYGSFYAPETFVVMYSTTTNDVASFVALGDEITADEDISDGGSFSTYTGTLPAEAKYFAIKYTTVWSYYLLIDNMTFTLGAGAGEAPVVTITAPASTRVGMSTTLTANISTVDPVTAIAWAFEGATPATADTETATVTWDAAGTYNYSVTVSNANGDATATGTINVIDCTVSEFPYTESFDAGIPECWTNIDYDADGHTWILLSEFTDEIESHTGADAVASASFINGGVGALLADNFLITPPIVVPSTGIYMASWFAKSVDDSYPDSYKVYVTTDASVSAITAATPVYNGEAPADWGQQLISLEEFAGQTVYVTFRHQNYDAYWMLMDDFEVATAAATPEIQLVSTIEGNVDADVDFDITGVVMNMSLEAMTSFDVTYSIDGGENVATYNVTGINVAMGATYEFTHNVPANLAAGTHTLTVTVSNPNGETDNVADNTLTTDLRACAAISSFPYTEEFATETAECWIMGNGAQLYNEPSYGSTGDDWFVFFGTNADVLSPALVLTDGGTITFDAYSQYASYGMTSDFAVYAKVNGAYELQATLTAEETDFAPLTCNLPAGTTGVRIAVTTYYGALLDHVVITANTVAVEEENLDAIAVYPNPANNFVTVANAEGQDIVIVNTLGQTVSIINNAAANQTIDLSNYANGTYFVKVNNEVVKVNVVK